MLKSILNFFIFSSLYIALCAVVMVYQVQLLFPQVTISPVLYAFIFFSTVCSYNFHWYLTQYSANASERVQWTLRYKPVHLILYFIGLGGAVICFIILKAHWFWIVLGAAVTFLYSAPKIPQKIFMGLRQIAIGKTVFLAFVWMYVTTLLPLLISGYAWRAGFTWLAFSRFFLIYAICILFDYRDREDDKSDGIRSMITWLSERGIDKLFALSIALFALCSAMLFTAGVALPVVFILLVPGAIVCALYNYAKNYFSDYLYYLVLDGLMMLSGLLMVVFYI